MESIVAKCTVAHRSTVQLDAPNKASIGLNISEEDAKDFEVGKSYAVSFEETEPEEEENEEDAVVGRPGNRPQTMHASNTLRQGAENVVGPQGVGGIPERGLAANPAERLEQPNIPSQPGNPAQPGQKPSIGNTQVNPPRP